MRIGGGVGVITSFGVATLIPASEERLDHLIQRPEQSLYRSKENGRNRVTATNP